MKHRRNEFELLRFHSFDSFNSWLSPAIPFVSFVYFVVVKMRLCKFKKGQSILDDEVKALRSKKLIEGRRPSIHVSADVAAATDTMVDYLKKRGIDKEYCQRMVVEFLQKKAEVSRPEIESLLLAKLSDALDEDQKKNFIKNLLQEMKRDGIVRPVEGKRGRGAKWQLSKKESKDGI